MKRILFTASAAAMLLAGCSDEMSDRYASGVDSGELIRIYASISDETGENTRTSLGAYDGNVFPYKWDDADAIGVFPVGEDGKAVPHTNAIFKYDAANKEPGKTAFLGTPQILRYDDIWSYYPWSANTTMENDIIELNIRPYQNYNFSAVPERPLDDLTIPTGSFAQGEAPSVAWGSIKVADDNSYTFNLQFHPLAGYLAVPITGEGKVGSVSITVRVGEGSDDSYVKLAGTLKIDMSKGVDNLGNPGFASQNGAYATVEGTPTPETGGMITVECGRGVQLNPETPTWFWFVVPANMPTTNDTHVDIYVDGSKKFTYTFNRDNDKTIITKNQTLRLLNPENDRKVFEYTEEDAEEEDEELVIPDDMTIAFPDDNFRTYVLENFDKDKDGKISKKEALDVTIIECGGSSPRKQIYTLEGIQYFPNLTILDCSYCRINTLDLSKNTVLETLRCNYNMLTALDVSNNTFLTELYCQENQLITLDLSNNNNTALTHLECQDNQLKTLDVSQNTALTYLYCKNNKLTTLDVSGCTALTYLDCESNKLKTLDVGQNTALTYLVCNKNQLTALDVTQNTALTSLLCNENQLTALDVSQNIALTRLYCKYNQLTILDLSQNIALTGLDCTYNRQLSSLELGNNNVLMSIECSSCSLISLDLRGCISMRQLLCDWNKLTYLNVSECPDMAYMICSGNKLTDLDVSACTNLSTLDCSDNQLTTLNVSNNTKLRTFFCYSNQLIDLDVRQITDLFRFECQNNLLTTLDVSKNINLDGLKCKMESLEILYLKRGQKIPSFNKHDNTKIVYID